MSLISVNFRQFCRKSTNIQIFHWLKIAATVLVFGLGLNAPLAHAIEATYPHLEFNHYNLVNLSGKDFYRFLTGRDIADREKAQMYMVGVWDSTEGKSWCEFKRFKSITLQETVYRYFDHLPAQRLNERAAKLIEEALMENRACKSHK